MDFDERRIDLVKTSIKNVNSGQKIISKSLDNKVHVHWPKEDEYLGNESILDHLTCDDANWAYEYLGEAVVERQVPGDGQKAHGGDIAIKKIVNPAVLTSIITKDEEDKEVKKACLDRLDELYIE